MRAPGKISGEALFALLRAGAEVVEMFAVALWTASRNRAPEAAIVALEALSFAGESVVWGAGVLRRRLVVRERDGAVLALELFAAGAADDGERVAAAVKQDNGLLAALQCSLGLLDERAREEIFLAGLLEFTTHVDELDFGQRAVHHALAQLDAAVLALCGVLPAFERRRRRAQHYDGIRKLGAHHGDIARVVARRLFLLVALVVFFVDEDEAEVGRGREDCRARADDDLRFSAADAPPLLAAFFRRERGMQQRHLLAEGGIEQARGLRCQADLRHQQDGGQAAVQRLPHGCQVDGGFARAGDTVQQEGMESAERFSDGAERALLRGVQLNGNRGGRKTTEAECGRALFNSHEAAAHERLQR